MAATDEEVIQAVTQHVYDRHSSLTRSNVIGWVEEDLDRVKVENGYLVFTVENVTIEEREEVNELDSPVWYVAATCFFQVTEGEEIEGSEDVYEAYQDDKGEWCIQWDHC